MKQLCDDLRRFAIEVDQLGFYLSGRLGERACLDLSERMFAAAEQAEARMAAKSHPALYHRALNSACPDMCGVADMPRNGAPILAGAYLWCFSIVQTGEPVQIRHDAEPDRFVTLCSIEHPDRCWVDRHLMRASVLRVYRHARNPLRHWGV